MTKKLKTRHRFEFMGRTWQLYRRGTGRRQPGASTPWSYRMTVGGKRVLISTRTAHVSDAVDAAKLRIRAVMSGRLDTRDVARARTGKGRVPTFAAVREVYTAAKVVRPKTARGNILSLERLVRTAGGFGEAGPMKIDVLSEDLGLRWLALKQGLDVPDYGTVRRVNVGANSVLRQAQMVFARRHRRIWSGWRLPESLDGFLRVRALPEPAPRFVPIDETLIAKLDRAAAKLQEGEWPKGLEQPPKCSAQDLWEVNRAIRLMGLRDSEVLAMKTSWLVKHAGRLCLEVAARPGASVPKGHCGKVVVPRVLEPLWRERSRRDHAEFLIAPAALPTNRFDLVYRTHSRWVRKFIGDNRRKTNHELRKHAGSLVAVKFNSWEAAARFLREDLETAKKHYLDLLQPVGLEVEDLAHRPGPKPGKVAGG
jgi:hypothetical protein